MIGKIKPTKRIEFKSLGSKPALLFILFIVILFFGVVVLESTFNIAEEMDITRGLNTSETVLADNASAQTLSNTPTSITSTTAWNNSWLSFDGVNDKIELANFKSDANGFYSNLNHSFSLWFNLSDGLDSNRLVFLNPGLWGIGTESNVGNITFYNRNSSNINIAVTTKLEYNHSSWYYLTINFNKNLDNASIYINGVLENSNVHESTSDSGGSSIDIDFSSTTSNLAYKGYMDEIRLYNRTITETEISEIYNSGRVANSSLSSTGLVLWLPMNENSGTDIHSFNQSDFT